MPNNRIRVFVSPINYGRTSPRPLEILQEADVDATILGPDRPLTEDEIIGHLSQGYDGLIAGLEPLTARVMDAAPNLKLIARVGIGFNNVDLLAARERGIAVTYTPDAPTMSVTEMTIGMMITLQRQMIAADRVIRQGDWRMFIGPRLGRSTVGLIGVGRIGKAVARALRGGFPGCRVLGNDLEPNAEFGCEVGLEWTDKETIFRICDIVSVHIPLTKSNRGLVGAPQLAMMKPGAILIDTSRGTIIDEKALVDALRTGRLGGVGKDVFAGEPYSGPLVGFDNVLLTAHMGGASEDSRLALESGAAQEAANLALGRPYDNPVPDVEYRRAAEERGES